MLSRCFLDFSVGVGAFVIGLSQISSFSLMILITDSSNTSLDKFWKIILGPHMISFFQFIQNRSPYDIYDSWQCMETSLLYTTCEFVLPSAELDTTERRGSQTVTTVKP